MMRRYLLSALGVSAAFVIAAIILFLQRHRLPVSYLNNREMTDSLLSLWNHADTNGSFASVIVPTRPDAPCRKDIPEKKRGTVRIVATGDLMVGRSVNTRTLSRGDFLWPYGTTRTMLSNADIALVNLETPLVGDCPLRDDGMVFCGDIRHAEAMSRAGVDVANFANNHASNYGADGIIQTVSELKRHGVRVSGVGDDVRMTIEGTVFAFLGFNGIGYSMPPIAAAREDEIRSAVSKAAASSDVTVVSFHWGDEYVRMPGMLERKLARIAVESGADLLIGNHPHWIQPFEFIGPSFVMYSHGNYIFDQMWSEETKTGVLGIYDFSGSTLTDIRFAPIGIRDYGQAYLLEGEERSRVIDMLCEASGGLAQIPDK